MHNIKLDYNRGLIHFFFPEKYIIKIINYILFSFSNIQLSYMILFLNIPYNNQNSIDIG